VLFPEPGTAGHDKQMVAHLPFLARLKRGQAAAAHGIKAQARAAVS
jgi:hypothetical protein